MAHVRKRKDRGTWELEYFDPSQATPQKPKGKRYRINYGDDENAARLALAEVERLIHHYKVGWVSRIGNILKKMRKEAEPEVEEDEREKRILLSEFIILHENIVRDKLKPNTLENYYYAFRSILEVMGDISIDLITIKDVSDWKEKATRFIRVKNNDGEWVRKDTGKKLSQATISIYGRSLKAAWKKAIEQGYADENPFAIGWPGGEDTRKENACMSFNEAARFLDVVSKDGDERHAVFFSLSAYTGLRRGELLGIKGKDIDPKKMALTVSITKQRKKKTKRLTVPLGKSLYAVLKDIKIEPEDYLFQTRAWSHKDVSKPWSKTYVTKVFRRFADKAGLPKSYSLHSFRHTFVTLIHQKNIPTQAIQRLIGHSSPDITILEYDHTEPLAFRNVVDLLDFSISPENED